MSNYVQMNKPLILRGDLEKTTPFANGWNCKTNNNQIQVNNSTA